MDTLRRLVFLLWQRLRPAPAVMPAAAVMVPLQDAPLDVLGAKVLFSYLRNRQQMLGAPPTAFGHLDASQSELLVRAMIAAAGASGRVDAGKERQLRGALSTFGLEPDAPGFVDGAIAHPVPLEVLLADVRDVHVASLLYAASLAAVDKHAEVNRAYLAYLAIRLKLPGDALARLHAQYGYGG